MAKRARAKPEGGNLSILVKKRASFFDMLNKEAERVNEHETVQAMQDFLARYALGPAFRWPQLYAAVGYSPRHADRLFCRAVGMTPRAYVQAMRLSQSAARLRESGQTVLDVALESSFESHEGFTRAFQSRFHVTPQAYRKRPVAIPLFIPYPVLHADRLRHQKEETMMDANLFLCTVTPQQRPARKLIYQPAQHAVDYLSYCEEKGCEWEGLLNSIPEKFDTAALLELPPQLVPQGACAIAAGVEVPADYAAPLPAGYETALLEPCVMLYFQGAPYEQEEAFCEAIEGVYQAVNAYDAARYGYRFARQLAPLFNFGADSKTGARLAVPAETV